MAVTGRRGSTTGIAAVVGAALVWSTSYAVTKILLADMGPIYLGAVRFALAAPVLVLLVVVTGAKARPSRRDLLAHGAGGLLGITAYFAVENIGVALASAADAVLIVASYPLTATILELVVLRRRIPPKQWAGIGLVVAGAMLIAGRSAAGQPGRLGGDLLLFSGGIIWACYNLVTKDAGARTGPIVGTCCQTVVGAAGFVLLALVVPSGRVPKHGVHALGVVLPDGADTALLCYLALCCSVTGFLLYNFGLQRLSPSSAVGILNLVPFFGMISAVLLNGDRVSPLQVCGGIVVVAGVAFGARETDSKTADSKTGADDAGEPEAAVAADRSPGLPRVDIESTDPQPGLNDRRTLTLDIRRGETS
jgi:drug/metabolite transporter (DMT)-like permease